MSNEWQTGEYAEAYLSRVEEIPHRSVAESLLLSELPERVETVLDLGCGDGHLLAKVLDAHPEATGVGVDFSPTMLEHARRRFENRATVQIVEHNLDAPLQQFGRFDCIVSCFAIHHCDDERKREIYREVHSMLNASGVFCNLEHVASPTPRLHDRFLSEFGITAEEEDPSNQLLDVETQLSWMRDLGFEDVDCYWKWRELALMIGKRASASTD